MARHAHEEPDRFAPTHDRAPSRDDRSEARTSARRGVWRYVDEPPPGLVYVPQFLAPDESAFLLDEVRRLEFRAVEMRGQVAKRSVAHFGFRYGYDSWTLEPAPAPPPFLCALRKRCARLARVDDGALEQILVARYPAGAAIGWHRDAPFFGPVVVGVSLGADACLRFRRRTASGIEIHRRPLVHGSAYVLGGAARAAWQHSLSPVAAERYSITFRTVEQRGRAGAP